MNIPLFFVLSFFLGAIGISVASGQTSVSQQSRALSVNADYARFRYDERSVVLEVYFAVHPLNLSYNLFGGKRHSWVNFLISIQSQSGNKTMYSDRVSMPVEVPDSIPLSNTNMFVAKTGYRIDPGPCLLRILAIDSLGSHRKDSVVFELSEFVLPPSVSVSEVELCSNIQASENEKDPFYKNSLLLVPNPSSVFGVSTSPVLFSYTELYNLSPESTYTLKSAIMNSDNEVIKESQKSNRYNFRNVVDVETFNVFSLPSGKYRLQLLVFDGPGKEIAKTSKSFFVYNPHKESDHVPLKLGKNDLSGLTEAEITEEFRKAVYLSTKEDIERFSTVQSGEGKREFLEKFWDEIEIGRIGMPRFTRGQYLQRVEKADRRYRSFNKPGWRTDRGRVNILHGDPDEVERYPSSENAKPYEIWRYFQIENGVEFIFVDRSGFGDYVLVHSTKRGELRDDSWQRQLR